MAGFEVVPSEEVAYRDDFALLCNARGVVDAVEVGTDHGVFARRFLDRFEGSWLVCVDPYQPVDEFPVDRTPDMVAAVSALMPHHGRFRFVRGRSPEVIPFVLAHYSKIGFVYVDGAHDEASVAADLEGWWDVLSPGGILAGHDFDDAHPGVKAAVLAFAEARALTVRLTHERGAPPSFYCYKGGEPRTLVSRFFRAGESPNPRHPGKP